MGNAFAAPSVTAEYACKLAAMGNRRHSQRQIPDRFQRLPHNRRRPEQNPVCESQFLHGFARVCLYHIIKADINIPAFPDPFRNVLCQLFCISVSTDIGDNNGFLLIRIADVTPFLIPLVDLLQLCIQNRPVTGTYHRNIQLAHPLQRLDHIGLKGADDTVKIILRSLFIILPILHSAQQHIVKSIMRAKRITGYEDLLLLNVSVHRIRPVQVRHSHKIQRLIPNPHTLPVFNHNSRKIPVHDLFQKTVCSPGRNNFQMRTHIQKPLYASRVIRLRMTYDQIINLTDCSHFFQFFQVIIPKFLFSCLEQNCLIPGL